MSFFFVVFGAGALAVAVAVASGGGYSCRGRLLTTASIIVYLSHLGG